MKRPSKTRLIEDKVQEQAPRASGTASLSLRRLDSPNETDLTVLGMLYDRAFDDLKGRVSIETLLRSSGSWAVLAEFQTAQGRLAVGFLIGAVAADEAEIFTIGVDPDWRKDRVGTALVTAFLEQARHKGAAQSFLEVAIDNKPAQALYISAGFYEVGQRRDYYRRKAGKRVDALILRSDL